MDKKYFFLLLLGVIFLSGILFLPKFVALAENPSFEVYGPGEKSYPTIGAVTATRAGNYEVIRIKNVADQSGVASVLVSISVEDSENSGQYKTVTSNREANDKALLPDTIANDAEYAVAIDVSGWGENTYWVNVSTTDNFEHNSMAESNNQDFVRVTSFQIGTTDMQCATSSKGAKVCIDVNPNFITSSVASQPISSLSASVSGNAVSAAAVLPQEASGGSVYFIDQAEGALGEASVDSSGNVSFTYTYSAFSGTHYIIAIYPGDISKNISPSVKLTAVSK